MAIESWRAEDSKLLIKKMADDRGITVTRLAMDAGITPSTISSGLGRGKNGPTKEVIQRLCDAYDISLAEFYMKKSDSLIEVGTDITNRSEQRQELLEFCSNCPENVVLRLTELIKKNDFMNIQ